MKSFLTRTILAVMALSMVAMAANPAVANGTNTVSGSIAIQVNVQTAVRLTFIQGTTAVNGGGACALGGSVTVGTPSDISFNFGDVDGLGISTPACGGLVGTTATSATYATSYRVKGEWSGFAAAADGEVTVASAGFSNSATLTVLEGDTTASLAAPATFTFAANESGTEKERFLGVRVLNNNGSAATRYNGADAALVTYTMVVN